MNIVYFLQREDGYIKIGTTRDYKTRLSNLIRQYGDLTLLGLMAGSYDTEDNLHQEFSEHQIDRTEFFKPHDELLKFIEENAHLELEIVLGEQFEVLDNPTKRLAVRPSIFEDMRDFSSGLRGNYSEVLEFMLRSFQKPNESAFEAGQRLREQFQRTHSGVKADKP